MTVCFCDSPNLVQHISDITDNNQPRNLRDYEESATVLVPPPAPVASAMKPSTIAAKACETKRKNFAYKKPIYIYNLDSRENCCVSCEQMSAPTVSKLGSRTVEDAEMISCYPNNCVESRRIHKF